MTETVEIRPATGEDRDACANLLKMLTAATGSAWETKLSAFDAFVDQSRGALLVADRAGELLGLASISFNIALRYDGEYCQLEELVVAPEARGLNLGAKLMEATLTTARARGCKDFGLYLIESTEKNQAFYEKFGFERVGSEMRQSL